MEQYSIVFKATFICSQEVQDNCYNDETSRERKQPQVSLVSATEIVKPQFREYLCRYIYLFSKFILWIVSKAYRIGWVRSIEVLLY